MTNKELQDELQKYPDDMEVFTYITVGNRLLPVCNVQTESYTDGNGGIKEYIVIT